MQKQILDLPSGLQISTTINGPEKSPLVLLIHGWSCRAADWYPLMNSLGNEFRFAAIDLPGHGESRGETAQDWKVREMAEIVAEAARELTSGPLTLAGHSMGGAVALEAARLLPKACHAIMVDTFIIPYGDVTESTAQKMEQPFYADFSQAVATLVDNSTRTDLEDEVRQKLKAEMSEGNPHQMLPLWTDLLRWKPERAFEELSIPIDAINGELVSDTARDRCSPRVNEWKLEGAAHFPQFEMPERFAECFRKVLLGAA